MRERLGWVSGLVLLLLSAAVPGAAASRDDLLTESRDIVQRFMGELKGELLEALRAGGPVRAVEVCRLKAPELARRESERTGFRVGRTSLRVRNPANAPDAWEREVLKRFEEASREGGDLGSLDFSEVVDHGGKKVFRYMKAIPMAAPCLTCHGDSLPDALSAELSKLYPQDRAVGFKLGEVRGAFTLQRVLD